MSEDREQTYCAVANLLPADHPAHAEDRRYRLQDARELVARAIASKLCDGRRYVVRLVEDESPSCAPFHGTTVRIRAEFTPVLTRHVTLYGPPEIAEVRRPFEPHPPAPGLLRRLARRVAGFFRR